MFGYWISLSQSVDALWSWMMCLIFWKHFSVICFAVMQMFRLWIFISFQKFDIRHRNVQCGDIPRHWAVASHGWKGEKKSIGGRCSVDLQFKYALNLNGPFPIRYSIVCLFKYFLAAKAQLNTCTFVCVCLSVCPSQNWISPCFL